MGIFTGLLCLCALGSTSANSLCSLVCVYGGRVCELICGDIWSEITLMKTSIQYYQSMYSNLLRESAQPAYSSINTAIPDMDRLHCNSSTVSLYHACQSQLNKCKTQLMLPVVINPRYDYLPTSEETDLLPLMWIWTMYLVRCCLLYSNTEWVWNKDTIPPCA